MTITVTRDTEPDGEGGEMTKEFVITINHITSMDNFKELLRRGLNTWDDAPPELKQLGDMLDHGHVLQTYDTVRPLNLSSNDVGADQYPGLGGEDLPLCPICGARGLAHHYNCPTMIKDNAISEEVKDS